MEYLPLICHYDGPVRRKAILDISNNSFDDTWNSSKNPIYTKKELMNKTLDDIYTKQALQNY